MLQAAFFENMDVTWMMNRATGGFFRVGKEGSKPFPMQIAVGWGFEYTHAPLAKGNVLVELGALTKVAGEVNQVLA